MENKVKRIIVKNSIKKELLISDDFDYENVIITIQKDGVLDLKIAFINNAKNMQIKVILKDNAIFNGIFADFSSTSFKFTSLVRLDGINSHANWKLSCLSRLDENKVFDISFLHNNILTFSSMENYGVGMNNSHLVFKGVSHIQNGAHKSVAKQVAKIIVFDDGVYASSSPSLRIDENDVDASHSAIVGKLNEEHLFYLKTRGLNDEEARRLITFGYLSPIANYFDNEMRQTILDKIESRF
jgi:Fe-S cluster assembly protein SufD